jgi:hypothetical protein
MFFSGRRRRHHRLLLVVASSVPCQHHHALFQRHNPDMLPQCHPDPFDTTVVAQQGLLLRHRHQHHHHRTRWDPSQSQSWYTPKAVLHPSGSIRVAIVQQIWHIVAPSALLQRSMDDFDTFGEGHSPRREHLRTNRMLPTKDDDRCNELFQS